MLETTHYYRKETLVELIRIFKQVTKDGSDLAFMSKYYKLVTKNELSPEIITAKIRESLVYKAATAESLNEIPKE